MLLSKRAQKYVEVIIKHCVDNGMSIESTMGLHNHLVRIMNSLDKYEGHIAETLESASTDKQQAKGKNYQNSVMDEIATVLSNCKGASASDQNMIGIAVIKLRQLSNCRASVTFKRWSHFRMKMRESGTGRYVLYNDIAYIARYTIALFVRCEAALNSAGIERSLRDDIRKFINQS